MLLEAGLNLGHKDALLYFLDSVRSRSVSDNRFLLALILKQEGTDINAGFGGHYNERTALHIARSKNNKKGTALLLEFGADDSLPDPGPLRKKKKGTALNTATSR